MRVAVVDMGTNSTRLLVADVADGRVSEVERRSTVTRLGRGVDTSRQLAAEAIEDVCRHGRRVHRGLRVARGRAGDRDRHQRRAGRGELGGVPRRASGALRARRPHPRGSRGGAARLPRRVRRAAGRGHHPGGRHRRGLARSWWSGSGGEVGFYASLQAGTVRHTERYLRTDPPDAGELDELASDVRSLIDAELTGEAIAARRRGDRRRRHADLAGRDRPGARPLRPRARPRLQASLRIDPADVLAAVVQDARGAAQGHRACIRAGRRRSSPAS